MYKRFTDRARKVMQLANQEAQRFNHEYIDSQHILLGLIKEGSGVAADVLTDAHTAVHEQEVWICWNECPSGRAIFPINVASSARDRLPVTPRKTSTKPT